MMHETQIVEGLVKGDRESFKSMFLLYYPKVLYFIQGMVKSREVAEDLTQNVFMKIWISREKFSEVTSFDNYLFIMTKNVVLNYFRSQKDKYMENIDDYTFEQPLDSVTPYETLVEKDTKLLVEMVVDNMPPQRKMVYQLSRKNGLSNEEIAQKMQISKKTVENHLNLALKELKKILYIFTVVFFS